MSFPPCVKIWANNTKKRKNSYKIIVRNHRFARHKCGTIFVSKKHINKMEKAKKYRTVRTADTFSSVYLVIQNMHICFIYSL